MKINRENKDLHKAIQNQSLLWGTTIINKMTMINKIINKRVKAQETTCKNSHITTTIMSLNQYLKMSRQNIQIILIHN